MKRRLATLLMCALLGACSSVSYTVTQSASTAPTTSSSYIATQSVAATFLFAGLLAAAWYGGDGVNYAYGSGHGYGPNQEYVWNGQRSLWTPPLDEARSVHVQNCTQPIENPTANLRCR